MKIKDPLGTCYVPLITPVYIDKNRVDRTFSSATNPIKTEKAGQVMSGLL